MRRAGVVMALWALPAVAGGAPANVWELLGTTKDGRYLAWRGSDGDPMGGEPSTVVQDLLTGVQTVYLGQLSAGSFASWTPSSIYSYSVNLNMPGMIVNGVAEISFTFSSQGSSGSWQIDDVYIDPFKGT